MRERLFLSACQTQPERVTRRLCLGAIAGIAFAARHAEATIMRGLTLEALVQKSDAVVIATALEAASRYVTLGGSRRIVTDTRLRIEEHVAHGAPPREVVVRVLGGRIGHAAELVEGQAELTPGVPSVLFLRAAGAELHWVNGMAQGHYPLQNAENGARFLVPSPRLPELLARAGSAVERLSGCELAEARALISGAARR